MMMQDATARWADLRAIGLHDYPDEHIALFQDTVERLKPTHIFEWGTNWGESARIWYELTEGQDPLCQIHTTDINMLGAPCGEHPGHLHGHWIRGQTVMDRPRLHWRRGEGCETSIRLWKVLLPEHSLFFIDDSHRVLANARYLRAISHECPPAVIIVHDSGVGGEPRAAVDSFLRRHGDGYKVTEVAATSGAIRLWPT